MRIPRYPVVLVHGIGYRDNLPLISYWGRIPAALRRHGIPVYVSTIEAWAACASNAAALGKELDAVIDKSGGGKVNLIAHSKGGLDARFLISRLGYGDRVASLTTVGTPHRGSALADYVVTGFRRFRKQYGALLHIFARLFGDRSPDCSRTLDGLTVAAMKEFNRAVPDDDRVFYQSLAGSLKNGVDDPLFYLPYRLLVRREGPNDGLVSVASAAWGHIRTVMGNGKGGRGLSHLEITDFKRRTIAGFRVSQIYVEMAGELAERGF